MPIITSGWLGGNYLVAQVQLDQLGRTAELQGAKVLIRRAGLLWGQLINFIFLEDKFIHRLPRLSNV